MSEDRPRDTTRHGAIAWMARNSIAAHLIMIILLVGGIWTALTMQKEVDPNFQLDVVEVSVRYPGAAPEEVSRAICGRIEDALALAAGQA